MEKNKYGLSRNIPSTIKKAVRKACGYGCIICGNAIYEYEHIQPSYVEAKEHDPEGIGLLCGTCHGNVTRKVWSKEKVKKARQKPACNQQGFSSFALDISENESFIIQVGNTKFLNLHSIIEIDGERILYIERPEEPNTPPRISAKFFDRNGTPIASIVNNEWIGLTDVFDIETKGNKIRVRSDTGKIDLVLTIEAPRLIIVDTLNLFYKDTTIIGNSKNGFSVTHCISSIGIPSVTEMVQKAPFWISVKNNELHLGTDEVITFTDAFGQSTKLPGHYHVDGTKLEFVDPEIEGVELPQDAKPGDKLMKITATKDGGTLSFIPQSRATHNADEVTKIGRNHPCPCGSGKKYKRCHGSKV